MAVAQCPASCGELIQGWILGGEKLVSCPVDWYSTVEATAGQPALDVLLLESPLILRTADYHRLPRQKVLLDDAGRLDNAWRML